MAAVIGHVGQDGREYNVFPVDAIGMDYSAVLLCIVKACLS